MPLLGRRGAAIVHAMKAFGGRSTDPVTLGAAIIGIAAVLLLAPLMGDQLVFFGDQEQTRQAAASRQATVPAAAVLLVAAAGLLSQRRHLRALLAAVPAFVAVPLQFVAPDDAYGLLAYVIAAPISLGALLSAAVAPPRSVRVPTLLVAAVLVVGLTVLASPFTIMVLVAAIVWWRLPEEGLAVARAHRR
jgi:hypothetical protein